MVVPTVADLSSAIEQMAKDRVMGPRPLSDKTDQERIDEVLSTPLFMNHLPEEETMEKDSTLSAIRSLVFDGTPEEIAENFKRQGNECFQFGPLKYRDAIHYFTKGIEANSKDNALNSMIYANRAAVNLEIKNYRKVLNDCAKAIKLNPRNIKAFYRSIKALSCLDYVEDGIDCCLKALAVDAKNSAIKAALDSLYKRKAILDDLEGKRKLKEAQLKQNHDEIKRLMMSRGFNCIDAESDDELLKHPITADSRISLDSDTKTLNFPVLLLYPEKGQSDFISAFNENDSLYSHFQTIFGQEAAPWDPSYDYQPDTLELYFEVHPSIHKNGESRLVSLLKEVPASDAPSDSPAHRYVYTTLADVLRHDKFRIVSGVCTLIAVVRGSEFAFDFRRQYR